MEEIPRYAQCFVCGPENDIGLNVRFYWDGAVARAELIAGDRLEGYRGIWHGGILATVLDEAMVKAVLASGRVAMTGEMTVRFRRPIRIGTPLVLTGRVVHSRGRAHRCEAEARGTDGTLFGSATGTYIEVPESFKAELLQSVDT